MVTQVVAHGLGDRSGSTLTLIVGGALIELLRFFPALAWIGYRLTRALARRSRFGAIGKWKILPRHALPLTKVMKRCGLDSAFRAAPGCVSWGASRGVDAANLQHRHLPPRLRVVRSGRKRLVGLFPAFALPCMLPKLILHAGTAGGLSPTSG